MKIAIVAYIHFMDNELHQKAVNVKDNATWKDALFRSGFADELSWDEISNDISEAKQDFFDMDSMFSVFWLDPKVEVVE